MRCLQQKEIEYFMCHTRRSRVQRKSTGILKKTNPAAQNMYGVDIFCSDLFSAWLTQHLAALFNTYFSFSN
jgi:hypothetical protein